MDFTPGVLSLTGRGGQKIQSTLAKQLALYVVIYSPIQMAADLPENYAKYPGPFQFIRDVPVDWAETKVVAGEIGEFAAIARKDRGSEDWYLGAVTDDNERVLRLAARLSSMPGTAYRAEIYRDGDDADWERNPRAIAIETREARREDVWDIRLARGGGLAIRFKAASGANGS